MFVWDVLSIFIFLVLTLINGILWYVSSAGFCFNWNLFFKRKKQQLLSLLDFQETNRCEWLDSKSDQLYLHNFIYLQKGSPSYIFWLDFHFVTQNETRVIISAGNYWLWLNPIPSSFLKSHNLYQNKKSKLQNFFILSEH